MGGGNSTVHLVYRIHHGTPEEKEASAKGLLHKARQFKNKCTYTINKATHIIQTIIETT